MSEFWGVASAVVLDYLLWKVSGRPSGSWGECAQVVGLVRAHVVLGSAARRPRRSAPTAVTSTPLSQSQAWDTGSESH